VIVFGLVLSEALLELSFDVAAVICKVVEPFLIGLNYSLLLV